MNSLESRRHSLRIAVVLALFCVGFIRGYSPGLLNDTSTPVEITAHLGGRIRSFSLSPHTNFVEGIPNVRLTELTVRFPTGGTLRLTARQLDAIRARTPIKDEFWVIGPTAIQLYDSRDAKRFRIQ